MDIVRNKAANDSLLPLCGFMKESDALAVVTILSDFCGGAQFVVVQGEDFELFKWQIYSDMQTSLSKEMRVQVDCFVNGIIKGMHVGNMSGTTQLKNKK